MSQFINYFEIIKSEYEFLTFFKDTTVIFEEFAKVGLKLYEFREPYLAESVELSEKLVLLSEQTLEKAKTREKNGFRENRKNNIELEKLNKEMLKIRDRLDEINITFHKATEGLDKQFTALHQTLLQREQIISVVQIYGIDFAWTLKHAPKLQDLFISSQKIWDSHQRMMARRNNMVELSKKARSGLTEHQELIRNAKQNFLLLLLGQSRLLLLFIMPIDRLIFPSKDITTADWVTSTSQVIILFGLLMYLIFTLRNGRRYFVVPNIIICIISLISSYAMEYYGLSRSQDTFHNPNPDPKSPILNLPLGKIDSLYYSITTFTTTGYGDITPLSSTAKIVVSGEMLTGFIVSTFVMAIIATKFLSKKTVLESNKKD